MTDRLDRYAAAVLDVGLGLRPGQRLAVNAHIEHAPLARALADGAYRRGAHYVDIWYWDPYAKRSRIRHAPEETLAWTPPWLDHRYEQLAADGGALAIIAGDPEPDLLTGLDGRRAGLDRMPALASRFRVQQLAEVSWTIACYPTPAWAKAVFGTRDTERLWTYLERFLRLDQPDPVTALRQRLDTLRTRAKQLTALRLDAIHYRGDGTDLTVGLIPGAHWEISELTGPTGEPNVVNLPTEEVYTTPDRRRADGHITCTRPLALHGTIVRDLRLTLTDGVITDVSASTGADVVRAELAVDDGARRLGELALVDASSPIGQSGVTFLETLLDENATCHLAWGAGIPSVLPGWRDLTSEQRQDRGVNLSRTHIDFMVGGPDLTVTGIHHDGSTTELLRGEQWQPRAR
ncbi:aminopeptidase [Fodinicola acaciae]|uniref:aminopeptidase n=1 Tax=Fodinicola acaciae TaxID=2681555 RepID=UPI0013D2C313|nr:aminopeptidase [Fodinicola acaciae]